VSTDDDADFPAGTDQGPYGPGDVYELYVETTDRVSARRAKANEFFMTVNSTLLAVASLMAGPAWLPAVVVGLAGIALSLSWWHLIESYKALNAAKFRVVMRLESEMGVAPFSEEWDHLQARMGTRRYRLLSNVERVVPGVFIVLYACVAGTAALTTGSPLADWSPWG